MNRQLFLLKIFPLAFLLFAFSANAYADSAIPSIFLTGPAVMLALIPVILIEAYVYFRLFKIDLKKIVLGSTFSNLLTTIVGFPLTWSMNLLFFYLVSGLADAGVLNLEGTPGAVKSAFYGIFFYCWLAGMSVWSIVLAVTTHMFVTFWFSVYFEWKFLKWFFRKQTIELSVLKSGIWKANLLSYFILTAVLLVFIGSVI